MRSTSQQEIATPDNDNKHSVRSQFKESTKLLTYTAVFAALAVIMKFIGQYLTLTDSFKITLIYVIWLIAGAALGPLGGCAVSFASDFIGAIVLPTGPLNPLLLLGNALYGLIAGLAFMLTPSRFPAVKMIVSGVICTLLCTCLINSAAIWYSYGYYKTLTFFEYFIAFRLLQPVVAVINIVIAVAMIPLLKRMKLIAGGKNKAAGAYGADGAGAPENCDKSPETTQIKEDI